MILQKLWRMQTTQMIKRLSQIYLRELNVYCKPGTSKK